MHILLQHKLPYLKPGSFCTLIAYCLARPSPVATAACLIWCRLQTTKLLWLPTSYLYATHLINVHGVYCIDFEIISEIMAYKVVFQSLELRVHFLISM